MRKYLFLLILSLFIPFNTFAHEKLSDGWHIVKVASSQKKQCNRNNAWAYYENGVEKKRECALLQVHQGWQEAPSNSIPAIELVAQNNYNACEMDIRFTSDHVAVLSHNETITEYGTGKEIVIKNETLKTLKQYVMPLVKKKYVEKYSNNRIATFEEALSVARKNGLFLVLDLKVGTKSEIESLVQTIINAGMRNNVRYMSFNPMLLKYVRNKDSNADLQLLDKSSYSNSGTCDPGDYQNNPTQYCKSITTSGADQGKAQRDFYYGFLGSKLRIYGGKSPDELGIGTIAEATLPDQIASYPYNKYSIPTIPQAKLTFDSNVEVEAGTTKKIPYNYDGDGTVKCSSNNTSFVTCSVDNANKTIEIKGIASIDSVKVVVYATQGVGKSATGDIQLSVKVLPKALYKGEVSLNSSSVRMDKSEIKKIGYTYNGDGNLICNSSNSTYVVCRVNKTDKTIVVETLKPLNNTVTISLYATAGTNYDVSNTVTLSVNPLLTGTISVNSTGLKMSEGDFRIIGYNYNGDGNVICTSTDSLYVNCSVNQNTKILEIRVLKRIDKLVYVNIFGERGNNYSATSNVMIPIGAKLKSEISLEESSIKLNQGETKTVGYSYNGDGELVCISSSPNNVTCSIDKGNKKIAVKAINKPSGQITISLYGNAGINYGAASAVKLTVESNVEESLIPLDSDVNINGEIIKVKVKYANGNRITIGEFKKKFKQANSISMKDSNGNIVTNNDELVKTGNQLYYLKNYKIVIYGDVNGDGKVSALDYIKIKKHILKMGTITNELQLLAANFNDDATINTLDYIKIKKQILGMN